MSKSLANQNAELGIITKIARSFETAYPEFLRTAIQRIDKPMTVRSINGAGFCANQAYLKMMRLNMQSYTTLPPSSLYHPEDVLSGIVEDSINQYFQLCDEGGGRLHCTLWNGIDRVHLIADIEMVNDLAVSFLTRVSSPQRVFYLVPVSDARLSGEPSHTRLRPLQQQARASYQRPNRQNSPSDHLTLVK